MEEKKFKIVQSKKTRYILPNILTIAGVCLGISSIKFSFDLNFKLAVIFILLASILDALDGRIARLIKGTTEFGKELDSLTDFVSFGIAPAFVIYFWDSLSDRSTSRHQNIHFQTLLSVQHAYVCQLSIRSDVY